MSIQESIRFAWLPNDSTDQTVIIHCPTQWRKPLSRLIKASRTTPIPRNWRRLKLIAVVHCAKHTMSGVVFSYIIGIYLISQTNIM